jgi:MYXO-CTERM domain-containing protein
MWHRRWMGWALIVASVALARGAAAHVTLKVPLQRGGLADPNQKTGPCGNNGPRGEPTQLEPGATIVVEWDETIDHPGHFRISFDDDGTDFVDPTGYDDYTTDPATLLEGNIPDDGSSTFSQQVTLPYIECDNCTLQLIQVMTDKPPWGPDGGLDLYYRCADLVLVKPTSATTSSSTSSSAGPGGGGTDPGAGGGGTGGETTAASGGGGSGDGGGGASGGCGCAIDGRDGGGWAAAGTLLAALLGARRRRSGRRREGG